MFLICDLEADDKSKLEQLYYKYKDTLFKYAASIMKNQADAEDVLQTAFIKIAKNIKCINDIDSKETLSFLIVIIKNTAYDFKRKQSRQSEIPLEEIVDIEDIDSDINSVLSKIEYKKIVDIIRTIPTPYNEVLYMHFVRDFSAKEISRLLKRKLSTVKMQIVRGKKLLLERLLNLSH